MDLLHRKKRMTWKAVFLWSGLLTFVALVFFQSTAYALEDKEVIQILTKNEDLFESNTIGASVLRYLGWGFTILLVSIGKAAATLYDTCFGFVDFTKFKEVEAFLSQWKGVFIGLVCLSLLFIGILLCIGWDKKPKIVINLLIAVTVVTSSTYVMNQLNSFISKEVRGEILGGDRSSSAVFSTVGANLHDLVYIDQAVGIQNLNKKGNAETVYKKFTEEQFDNISINETVDPDDVSDQAEDIIANGVKMLFDRKHKSIYILDELYDGVAWTDLLNEYYYRYTVDWFPMWLELLSLIIIYLFMSYKVIRILYEIVMHRLLAYLYSANLNNNQKILKILDSLKDSYILLLMTTVMIKFYLLACEYIGNWKISGISKGFILLFLAFAVIDGPNLIQKLTGADIGASDGMGKIMSMFYGGRMIAGVAGGAVHAAKRGAGAVKNAATGFSNRMSELTNEAMNGEGVSPDMEQAAAGTAGGDALNNTENNQNNSQSTNQSNSQSNQQENQAGLHEEVQGSDDRTMPENPQGQSGADNAKEDPSGQKETGAVPGQDPSKGDGTSAISPEQGKQSGGYQMDDIGQGMQSQKDALNGASGELGSGAADLRQNQMQAMEKDLAAESGPGEGFQQKPANTPLETGGHILKGSEAGAKQAKTVFQETERK